MSLLLLPLELLLQIYSEDLPISSLVSLCATNRYLNTIFTPYLYERGVELCEYQRIYFRRKIWRPRQRSRDNPAEWAINNRRPSTMSKLLLYNLDPNIKVQIPPVIMCCATDCQKVSILVAAMAGGSRNMELDEAADIRIPRMLLENGADLNKVNNFRGCASLMELILENFNESHLQCEMFLEMLFEYGAVWDDIEWSNSHYGKALMEMKGHKKNWKALPMLVDNNVIDINTSSTVKDWKDTIRRCVETIEELEEVEKAFRKITKISDDVRADMEELMEEQRLTILESIPSSV
jgi:hypothetical protein